MRTRVEFDLANRWFHTLIVISVLILAVGIAAYNRPSAGHGADSVWVTVDGEEMSLQDAIDSLIIYESANPSMVANFGGMWGTPSGSGYTNPLVGNTEGCPAGYKQYQILGTANVDWPAFFCYEPL